MNLVVKNIDLIIKEYNMALTKANSENVLLKAYCTEMQQLYEELQEELNQLKYKISEYEK